MSKYTPGPWVYSHDTFDWGVVRDADGNWICQAKDPRVSYDDLTVFREQKRDPWEANARLISAAPDMAEALMAVLDFQKEHTRISLSVFDAAASWTKAVEKARAALKKAGIQ